ncbi:MAG TPA: hypothetical protein VHB73_03290 [Alphaproteobacteria bacterium]|nr:hypothetical protein [Alphaproteobacteria bacterium]
MRKSLIGLTGLAAAMVLTASSPAEARIVCRSGWGWDSHHSRCMQVNRHYGPGEALPAYVSYRSVPRARLVHLGRAPSGYRWVMVNDDVVLLGPHRRVVRVVH